MENKKQADTAKRIWGVVLSAALIITSFGGTTLSTQSEDTTVDYGLADNVQDGTILHCFNWTYNQIKEELPNIAAAGFTSVQTSPAQPSNMDSVTTSDTYKTWWWLYQPLDFKIAEDGELGTKDELKALCTAAEEYGIKVIVDVVSNHLGNYSTANSTGYDSKGLSTNIPEVFRNNTDYWHTYSTTEMNYSNRSQIINYALSGLPDLNTENEDIQNYVIEYLEECIDVGVDGFRFDTAKHIGVPGDSQTDGGTYDYWPNVISAATTYYKEQTGGELYCYGEILDGPGGSDNDGLMADYANYISVTDDVYGNNLRVKLNSKSVDGTSFGNWVARGIDNDKLVYWAESHDTYSNGSTSGASYGVSQNVIDRTYAIVASRDGATALYFSRPGSGATDKNAIKIGEKGSDAFKSTEVAAVNHFHNAMTGQADYYTTGSNCAVVCREQGAVIVAGNNETTVEVPNGGSTTEPGIYVDEITGNIWTVTNTTISGTIGNSGIAVIYGLVSAVPGTETFTTETLDITLSVNSNKITSAYYTTSEGNSGAFTDGDVITIGEDTTVTDTQKNITVNLYAFDESGQDYIYTYTYTKKDPNLKTMLYFDNTSSWSTVYVYVYDGAENNGTWPGVAMTRNSTTGLYEYEVPAGLENGKVIFVNKNNTSQRYPASTEPALEINGTSMKLTYSTKTWRSVTDTDDPVLTTGGVYFEKPGAWESVYVYIWDDSTNYTGGTWPGTAISELGDGVYYYECDLSGSNIKIIFNDGAGGTVGTAQTADLTYVQNGYYNLNGYIETIESVPTSTVTIKYKYGSEYGEEIANEYILTGNVGDTYTTFAKNIDGYKLDSIIGSAKDTYTEEPITITYCYFQIEEESSGGESSEEESSGEESSDNQSGETDTSTGTVIVRYVDESNREIAASKTITGKVGDSYETTAKTLAGYTLTTDSTSSVTGTFTQVTSTITFKYKSTPITTDTNFQIKTTLYKMAIDIEVSTTDGSAIPEGYTFAYYYKKTTDTNWIQATTYNTTTDLNIEFFIEGDYQIRVEIKDSDGAEKVNEIIDFTAEQ